MQTLFFPEPGRIFKDHPKFSGVQIAVLVSQTDTDSLGVSFLKIDPGVEIPVHTHDPQVDSIFVLSGQGEALINGSWKTVARGDYIFVPAQVEHGVRNTSTETLVLFVHHSPPLM